jgi:hydroxyacylglutathione hydrolase
MHIRLFTFSPFQENTYLVYTDQGEAMIIDPGCYTSAEENALKSFIDEHHLKVVLLVNTHLHIDHVFGNAFVEETWGIQASANKNDFFLLDIMQEHAGMFGLPGCRQAPPVGHSLSEGSVLSLGSEEFQILEVPGHSPGSIVLYHAAKNVAFVGDVLFSGSIGRTDLQGGNYGDLITGIQQKLLSLPDQTVVYSGHGPSTTIGQEKRENPYL